MLSQKTKDFQTAKMVCAMFNANPKIKEDPDPYAAGAPARKNADIVPLIHDDFKASVDTPEVKRLEPDDMHEFYTMHTYRRETLDPDQQRFMKKLSMELLDSLMEKNMPVIGLFVHGKMVSGCAVLYPSDGEIADYLNGYEFDGQTEKTAVVSAVWTHPDHNKKGYSKKVVEAGMDIAVMDGKEIFRAKVDKENKASLSIFEGFEYDTKVEGSDSRKVYPRLILV